MERKNPCTESRYCIRTNHIQYQNQLYETGKYETWKKHQSCLFIAVILWLLVVTSNFWKRQWKNYQVGVQISYYNILTFDCTGMQYPRYVPQVACYQIKSLALNYSVLKMKIKVVDNAMTWTTQRDKFLPLNFFPPEINFLYLPKNNQFFKQKNFYTCLKKSIFHAKKQFERIKISYPRQIWKINV